jgi:hypothetical protein
LAGHWLCYQLSQQPRRSVCPMDKYASVFRSADNH